MSCSPSDARASEASKIHQVDESFVRVVDAKDGAKLRTIVGIEEAFQACARSQRMLHESGLCPWTQPAGAKDLLGYRHFAGPRM